MTVGISRQNFTGHPLLPATYHLATYPMRFLFTSSPLPGHLDWGGFLQTASALRRRGHAVLWASGDAVAAPVKAADVDFRALAETGWRWPPPPPLALDPHADPEFVQQQRATRALDQWLDVARVRRATHALVEVANDFQPDVIVSELFVSAAGIAAEIVERPLAVVGWPALEPVAQPHNRAVAELARARLCELLSGFQVSGVNFSGLPREGVAADALGPPSLLSPQRHLTFWSARWYGDLPILPQTVHVGGAAAPIRLANPLPGRDKAADGPWVLVTLGTSFADDPNFFIAASRAVQRVGGVTLAVLGAVESTARQSLVERMAGKEGETLVVLDHADFDALLPHVDAAIQHGGAGTTHALVLHGVPQILVPHAADQYQQAQGVARCGNGFALRAQQTTPDNLARALFTLLPDLSAQRQSAQTLRREFAALGGIAHAADLLETVY